MSDDLSSNATGSVSALSVDGSLGRGAGDEPTTPTVPDHACVRGRSSARLLPKTRRLSPRRRPFSFAGVLADNIVRKLQDL